MQHKDGILDQGWWHKDGGMITGLRGWWCKVRAMGTTVWELGEAVLMVDGGIK